MTNARDSRQGAFMLMEALVGILLVGMLMGFATTVLVRAHHRFKEATRAADARAELARASRRMVGDIRRAAGAVAQEGGLVLTGSDGSRVSWLLCQGRLVRADANGEVVYRAEIEDMRVSIEGRAGASPYVAALLEAAPPKGGEGTGRGRIIYVAASPRVRAFAAPKGPRPRRRGAKP